MKKVFVVIALMLLVAVATINAYSADVIFVVDESGSMGGEHAWLGTMITSLESSLVAAGSTSNQYGLVGYGGHVAGQVGHSHLVGGADWGTAAEFSSATSGLVVSGGTEDGWQAIDYVLNNYTFRSGQALNIVLVTDEDRDNIAPSLSYGGMVSSLGSAGAMLNVVVDYNFSTAAQAIAVGLDSDYNAYAADGSGGYLASANGVLVGEGSSYNTNNKTAYIDLAFATGGAAWDLKQLRAGGLTGDSFTSAFVDIKTAEIIEEQEEESNGGNPIPEPMTMLLFGPALLGLVGLKRKKS